MILPAWAWAAVTATALASDLDPSDNMIGMRLPRALKGTQLVLLLDAPHARSTPSWLMLDGGTLQAHLTEHLVQAEVLGRVLSGSIQVWVPIEDEMPLGRALVFAGPKSGNRRYLKQGTHETNGIPWPPFADILSLAFPGSHLRVADDGALAFATGEPTCVVDDLLRVCGDREAPTTLDQLTQTMAAIASSNPDGRHLPYTATKPILQGSAARGSAIPSSSLHTDADGATWLIGAAFGFTTSNEIRELQKELASTRPTAHQVRAAHRLAELSEQGDRERYRKVSQWRYKEDVRRQTYGAFLAILSYRQQMTARREALALAGTHPAHLAAMLELEKLSHAAIDLRVDDQALRDQLIEGARRADRAMAGELLDPSLEATLSELATATSAPDEPHAPMP